MFARIGMLFGLVSLIGAAALLNSGIVNSDTDQLPSVLGGATMLALGAIVLWTIARNWWAWKKEYRRYRSGL